MSYIPIAIGAIALLAVPIICAYALYKGFSTGRMPARGGTYSRTDNPIYFWLLAAIYAGLPIFELSLIGRLVWEGLLGR